MNEILDWNDLRLFLAVARGGGLAGGAKAVRASAPTLGRRILALERGLGMRLFTRHQQGYELTSDGLELLAHAEEMERAVLGIERWRTSAAPNALVTIAAGEWTGAYLARNIAGLVAENDSLSVEIKTGSAATDLLRRQANLGLRNRRPDTQGLAGKRLGAVAFAVYGAKTFVQQHPQTRDDEMRYQSSAWIGFHPPGPLVPSAVWLAARLEADPKLKCSSTQAVLNAAQAGAGLCILPCFIGDLEQGLARASGCIEALTHDQWLVSHDDDRHDRAVRLVAQRLSTLFQRNARLFSGNQEQS
ncbi:MAG: LysR family transcriptional regulator [Alphaproteobacteria bacterium]|nr:LysR family transcriptional regulator [Alphaproteobacteria bacterium]